MRSERRLPPHAGTPTSPPPSAASPQPRASATANAPRLPSPQPPDFAPRPSPSADARQRTSACLSPSPVREEFSPQMRASWSGTRLVHQWELRPVARKPSDAALGGTPIGWQVDFTQVLWVAQRQGIPDRTTCTSGPLALERRLSDRPPRHGCPLVSVRFTRRSLVWQRRVPEWSNRFVHGSPVMQPERRWPDAVNSFETLPRPHRRYGLSQLS
ncbi:hypothetical protein AB1Y20_003294 [Prymnesium parvum]|uniref:Uncharacterized protein n=1 Tax=Prymnesium parvum TaxID=97485 RepID=A0AB34JBS4_PRYPA